ncbi:MAG: hypothetical protein HQL93_03410 [Magnetococcales bacterium]|nr:hypothetical protein [Magnetococcales bacterium]
MIELVVVMVVISIFASVGIGTYMDYRGSAQGAVWDGVTAAVLTAKAVAASRQETDACLYLSSLPTNWSCSSSVASIDITDPSSTTRNFAW